MTELIHFLFYLIPPVKFYLSYRNYDIISGLMKALNSEILREGLIDLWRFKKLFKFWIGFLAWYYLFVIVVQITELPADIIETVKNLVLFSFFLLSVAAGDFTNILLQFCYLNLCIQVCSLLKLLESHIVAMTSILDEKQIHEKIKNFVTLHELVICTSLKIFEAFKLVISFNFIVDNLFIGQALMFSEDSDWESFLGFDPYLIFAFWIYWYGTQLMITKVCKFQFVKFSWLFENFCVGSTTGDIILLCWLEWYWI